MGFRPSPLICFPTPNPLLVTRTMPYFLPRPKNIYVDFLHIPMHPHPHLQKASNRQQSKKIKMGQAMQKIQKKQEGVQIPDQQKEKIKAAVDKYISERGKEYEKAIQTKHGLYHVLYEIVAMLNEESGAMQFKIPSMEKLKTAYEDVRGNKTSKLTKDEFRQIIEKVVGLDCFYLGQGAKDIFLYIFGVPVLALLAKRVIPGPTRAISDDIFIPLSTTATVVFLAKTNRL